MRRARGFTLIEMAVVIVIVGIMIVAMMQAYNTWLQKNRMDVTRYRLAAIEEGIKEFVRNEGRLPCVAPAGDAAAVNAAYALETDCAAGVAAGVTEVAGRGGVAVRIGAVPVGSLNVTEDAAGRTRHNESFSAQHMVDGWGRRFTMAVTVPMAASAVGYQDGEGAISVVDSANNSLTRPVGTAQYVIVSHGPDGAGGRDGLSGAAFGACDPATQDGENCDGDSVFRRTVLTSTAGTAAQMDDIVSFAAKSLAGPPAISRYIISTMACNDSQSGGVGANPLGENCATLRATNQLYTTATGIYMGAATDPGLSKRLYEQSFTAETDGRVIVRATIPVRYFMAHCNATVLASVRLNGAEIGRGLIINASEDLQSSGGGTGVLVASGDIVRDQLYSLEIFIFSLGPSAGGDCPNIWLGTVRLQDHAVDGVVEIMESGRP